MKLLIVDDVMDNVKVVMSHLRCADFACELFYATNGRQAIERATMHKPDMILMDVMMPDMDGFEAVMRIKASPNLAQIPVIYVTARGEAEDISRGFATGGVDYITKPFNAEELLARIQTHAELYRYRTALQEQVSERTIEVENLKNIVIEALGGLAEYRDPETGWHIQRTQHYVKALANRLRSTESTLTH